MIGGGAAIRARLYFPTEPGWAEPVLALVYYHGGGFTVGSVDTHDALCGMTLQYGNDAQDWPRPTSVWLSREKCCAKP